ncbi:MAG: Asp-tRNA(Asn)/Glu-tRNA(Gln) amidotransferase subunit GatA [Cyclobacteriaceae bacterium]|nr:Asp-tRNA(Asn)/Glu-tRNA(Gln) amidotransferase subunit GatA [Cyclobacteriaceae bacterium]
MQRETATLSNIQVNLTRGTQTCESLVEGYLSRIAAAPDLHAFLSVYDEEALSQAREVDKKIRNQTAGKLAGLVVGLKDVFAYRDHPLTAASRILNSFTSPYNATVVTRLLEEDAIIIGRQNCDEFGMGSSTENSAFGPTRHPADPTRTPGGSSGGSAAAVAAGLCAASIGSDTGGSVRQPAAFCGIYGLKPTYGRISRHGLVSYASSFDTVGLMTRCLDDLAPLLAAVAGPDEHDSTASHQPVPDYARPEAEDRRFRIAVYREILDAPSLQPEVREALHRAMDQLNKQGHTVNVVHFPLLDYLLPTYYILATAEASSNLSRYDGVRFGHRAPEPANLESLYKRTRSEGFGPEVKRRILLGSFVLSADYHNAYYLQAQKVRRLIREETKQILRDHEVMLLPTAPTTAFPLGATSDPLSMYLADIFSVQANVAGVPALSFPFGADAHGLPVGLQVLADDFAEGTLLSFVRNFEVGR